MNQSRLSISAIIYLTAMILLGAYFAFSAVQGKFGLLRRVQIEAETQTLIAERDALQTDVADMQNLTRRLSDEYLDLDLLDERARQVLGLVRADEIVVR